MKRIVRMLGLFHTLMNFSGSIGTLMNGSGSIEVSQDIYDSNAVLHIMSGKTEYRDIRGNLILDAAPGSQLAPNVIKLKKT